MEATCALHQTKALFTCPRCGAFQCLQCRHPDDATQRLFREMGVMLQEDRSLAAKLCDACLQRPARARSGLPGLIFFGVVLVALLAAVFWLRDH